MLGLPKATEFNKRIPKQKFYEHLEVPPALKKSFTEQIRIVYWRNKLAASTINLAPGKTVTELEVFEIGLNGTELDEAVLRQIDRKIPYHILFLLRSANGLQAWIGYKEASASGGTAFKVNRYYHTDWLDEKELPLKLEGLDLDRVYENFVRQIAGGALDQAEAGEELKVSVTRQEEIGKLKLRLERLKTRLRKEKQLNRQVEINAEIKALKKDLAALSPEAL